MALKFALVVLLAAASANAQIVFGTGGPSQSMKTPASNTAPEQRCVLKGKAVNALTGEPLKKVSVRLIKINSEGATQGSMPGVEGYSDTSATDGTFKIDGIEPGEYYLSGERAGYLHSAYGAASRFSQGTRLTLSAGQQLTGLSLGMTPQSVITGHVVDQDGDPVGNVMVMALRQVWNNGRAQYFPMGNAQADEDGRFRLSSLQPGKYYVVVQTGFNGMSALVPPPSDKPDIRPVRTFYPDATTRENATPVMVRAGETSPDLEIHLQFQPGHHVRGKLAGQLSGSSDNLHLNIMPEDSDFPFGFNFDPRSTLKSDHTFDASGITPGRYWISVMQFNGNVRTVAEAEIEVGDSDVNGVDLLPVTPGTLHGQIAIHGTPPAGSPATSLKQIRVHLQPFDLRRIMFGPEQSETSDAGVFSIQNVGPGKYDINVEGVPKGAYVQSITYGSQEVTHKMLDLTAGVGGSCRSRSVMASPRWMGPLPRPTIPASRVRSQTPWCTFSPKMPRILASTQANPTRMRRFRKRIYRPEPTASLRRKASAR